MGAGFSALVSFLLIVFLGRAFGSAEFGHYAAVLSIAVIGLILIEGGWPTLLYRKDVDVSLGVDVVRHTTAHAVANVILVGLLLIGLSALPGLGDPALAGAFACMTGVAFANLVSARMRGKNRFGTEAAWQSSVRLLSALIIAAGVLMLGASITGVFAAWSIAITLMLLLWGRRWLKPPRWRGLRAAQRIAVPFLLVDLCMALLLRGDMAVLGLLQVPAHELSYYAVCGRFVEATVLMFAPVNNILLRSLRTGAATRPMFRRRLVLALAPAALLGLVVTGVAWLAGEAITAFVFGEDYRDAGRLLPWVAAALPALLVNLVLVQAANALGMERASARNLVFGAVALIVGLVVGNAWDGIFGAAKGALAAQSALMITSLLLVQPRLRA